MSVEVRRHPTGPVAGEFAARVQAREAEWLSPLGTPSYPATRAIGTRYGLQDT